MARRPTLLLLLGSIALVTAAPAQDAAAPRLHRVQAGETLWKIARLTVGDPTLWPALYLANRDQIKDPSRVYPGQELAIPEIDPARADALRREAATLTTR